MIPNRFLEKIAENARTHPENVAAIHQHQAITYSQLFEEARRIAQSLDAITGGERSVIASLPNSIEFLTTMLGCFLARVCFIPVNEADLLQDFYGDQLSHLSAGLIIVSPEQCESIGSKMPLAGTAVCTVAAFSSPAAALEAIQSTRSAMPPSPVNEARAAICLHTSGSTGAPKGALHTSQSLSLLSEELTNLLGYDVTDRFLVCLSMDRPFCLTSQVLPALYSGATLVIHERFEKHRVIDALKNCGITRLHLHPHQYRQLTVTDFDTITSDLRSCVAGAEICPVSTNISFQRIFGKEIAQSMGMVETLAYALNLTPTEKVGAAGKPICGAEIIIADEARQPVPAGERGEILVRTPLLMSGYAGTAPVCDEWFKTGDVGFLDSDGYLWHLGRKSLGNADLLNRLQLVKNEIYSVNGIREVAVIADERSLSVVAFVCLEDSFNQSLSLKKLEDATDHMQIEIRIVDSLPKLTTGKLDLRALKRLMSN